MNHTPRPTMTPDELALELLTTGRSMTRGRPEAERLLQQIKDRHAHQLAEQIREDAQARHESDYSDNRIFRLVGAQKAADLIDPDTPA